MESQMVINAKRYLTEFDKILCNMADKMLSRNIIGNITIDFIECMIPHHQAAIYMCENLLRYPTYSSLKEIAEDIIRMQTKGIEQMREIKRTTCGYYSSNREVKTYITKYLSIVKNMVYKMKNSPRCIDINLNFVNEMIPHHEGAVEMCNNLLMYCIDPRLKDVAETIIREQSEGIRQLEEVRRSLCR